MPRRGRAPNRSWRTIPRVMLIVGPQRSRPESKLAYHPTDRDDRAGGRGPFNVIARLRAGLLHLTWQTVPRGTFRATRLSFGAGPRDHPGFQRRDSLAECLVTCRPPALGARRGTGGYVPGRDDRAPEPFPWGLSWPRGVWSARSGHPGFAALTRGDKRSPLLGRLRLGLFPKSDIGFSRRRSNPVSPQSTPATSTAAQGANMMSHREHESFPAPPGAQALAHRPVPPRRTGKPW